ncbi:MAG TPA: bifunctional phosphoribosyl-AMP cyclohydrolase/phosphoribosyl-ATP diphosphatase HisIE [Terriglobia bacterium]|jgi:phosphoribosyl-AMP cyclohydrolase / phosphoribosyl-ATP pyrophosphohydrolase|nr:bifunctional phosphoribosyl-AMP cyclohydrolase/phosphoribosyl-ATP diphosphatase HisIE [Terriglobia bacterium]
MNDTGKDIVARAQFNADGLIPAVVQDARTREVLTVAYMNEEALRLTVEKGETHFYSRSRKALWHKGETSGNFQKVRRVSLDCDSDTVLVEVEPLGPACHTGSYSCFGVEAGFGGSLAQLYDLIATRKETRPEGSYTTRLFEEGIDKIAKKLGEEAVETVIAAKNDSSQRIVEETADLLYHLLVTLVAKGVSLEEIDEELRKRQKTGKRS